MADFEPCVPGYITFIGWLATASAFFAFYVTRRANSLPIVRNTISSIADVAGFWPITLHPLGARTYRPDAIEGIVDALDLTDGKLPVLVGHSQGSVLAAWTIGGPPGSIPGRKFDEPCVLVTCGSPLKSLYATFFPANFTSDFFEDVEKAVVHWGNFWRPTDPIATKLPYKNIENFELEDPELPDANEENHENEEKELKDPSPKVRGHSDYWIATKQQEWIDAHLVDQVEERPPSDEKVAAQSTVAK